MRSSQSSGSLSSVASSGGRTRVGKFELGRTLGEGNFAKVKFARNVESGEHVAIKILDKDKILKHKMIRQVIFLCVKSINLIFFVTKTQLILLIMLIFLISLMSSIILFLV